MNNATAVTSQDLGDPNPEKADAVVVPLRRLLAYFAGLGTWGFGGPIATVGYMQRDLVERRRWVSERDFVDGIALGQTMPGPLAAQVVMWVGFLRGRALVALLVSLAFIAPSFSVVLAVAALYERYGGLYAVQALFYGVAPGVIAIIAIAAVKLARTTAAADLRLWAITLSMFAATAWSGSEIAPLFIASGVLMVLLDARPGFLRRAPALAIVAGAPVSMAGGAALGTQASLFLFFLKAGAFIFGSGLAIVPFLREGVVEQHGWLNDQEFLDAVAMGMITPGPVVITATFIGYLVGGLTGAILATVAIFTPIYLGVVIPGPWFVRHRDNPQVRAFVRGATAAASGALAGATVIIARDAVHDLATMAIGATCCLLILRLKAKEPAIVVLAGAAGLVLY